MPLNQKERKALNDILELLVPNEVSKYGFTFNKATITKELWNSIENDQYIDIKLKTIYAILKRTYEKTVVPYTY